MQTIPEMTITHMGAAATICFIAPFLVLMAYKRNNPKIKVLRPTLYGIIIYLAFGGALLQVLHTLILGISPALADTIMSSPWIYTIYSGLMAALVEGFARYFGFRLLAKEPMGSSTPILFGTGYGGAGLVMNGAISLLNAVMMATTINALGVEGVLADAGDLTASVQATVDSLLQTGPIFYYVSAVEQILFFALQIILSILTYCAVTKPEVRYLLPVSMALHFLTGILSGLYQNGVITNVYVLLALLAGYLVVVGLYARTMYRRHVKGV